jgi:hypothetical protein
VFANRILLPVMTNQTAQASADDRSRGLWPLPGPSDDYLGTLATLLRAAADSPENKEFDARLRESFPSVSTTAPSYRQVLRVVGFVRTEGGRVALTSDGRSFLRAQRKSILAALLLRRVAGIQEIIEVLAAGALRVDELRIHLGARGFAWDRTSQVRYRLRWMEAGGLVRRVPLRYTSYVLTTVGQHAVEGTKQRTSN